MKKSIESIVKMNSMKFAIPLFVALAYGPAQAQASILGSDLASFAVLGATGVTNVPTSTIGGNLGSAPTASVGDGYVFTSGSLQSNTAIAQNAQVQLDTAITNLGLLGPGTLLPADLTGLISPGFAGLAPGVYTVPAGTTNLSGALTLDGGGNLNAFWLFQMPSTLITSTTSVVNVIGTGAGAGVFWNVGSAATLNGPTFAGNVLAQTLISSDGNLTLGCGRLLSATSAVTLIQDTISIGCFGDLLVGSNGLSGGTALSFDTGGNVVGPGGGVVVAAIPEPEIYAMMAVGLGLLGWVGRRKKLKEAAAA